jgi:WD40 repeat protein
MSFLLPLVVLLLGVAADGPKPLEVKIPSRTAPVSYTRDIADILDAKCAGCHGAALAAHRVEPVMPPKEKKDLPPLTSDELGLLKLWIDAGAKDDSDSAPTPAKPVEIGSLPVGVHPINALDITPDGHRVAAGRANLVQVFEVESGIEITRLGGHRDLIQSVRYSPDARRLAAGSYQIVTVWNAPTGTIERTFSGSNDAINAVIALRDGKTLVTAGVGKEIRFWNMADGKTFRTLAVPTGVDVLTLSSDEKLLAAAGPDGIVRVLDVADGKEKHTLKGHTGTVTAISFLREARTVVTAGVDGHVRIWTLNTKAGEAPTVRAIEVGARKPVRAMAATADGNMLITGGDDGIIRLHSLVAVDEIPVPGGPILALALSADGKTLLVGSEDKSARLIEVVSGKVASTFGPHAGPIRVVGFNAKGDRVLTGAADGAVKVWDVKGGRGVIAFGHPAAKPGDACPEVKRAFFLPDGRIVSAAEKTARTWTLEGSWSEGPTLGPHIFRVLAIDFSPDGKLLATGGGEPSRSGEVKIWDLESGKLVRSLDTLHSDTVFALRFSPDGKKLASASADKFLKVINVADGKELKSFEGHTHHVLAVDWKSDGKQLVTGGADSVVKVWDFESGEQVRTLNPAGKQITGLRWVPGKALVVGASGDAMVRAWNPDNGTVPRTFSGAADYVFAVAASSDGSRVAAGGADGVLLLWNGVNGQPLRKIAPVPTK